jgi:Pyruvate/2-oxoacid:ferredoxin oxidoreductase gamma subunit
MERELILTGVGGQGIQLAAQVLARAAVLEDRHVLMLGTYGGNMRGGSTDCALIVGDAPIASPPILSRTGSAIAMHHRFWEPVRAKLRPQALVLVNAGVFDAELDRSRHRVLEVPAREIAAQIGSPLAASLVLVGFYAGATGLVGADALVEAMRASLPAYRQQHAAQNEKAIRAGFAAAPPGAAPAWSGAAH